MRCARLPGSIGLNSLNMFTDHNWSESATSHAKLNSEDAGADYFSRSCVVLIPMIHKRIHI